MSLVYWWEILQAILRPTFSPNAISDVTTILSEFSLQIYLLPPFRFKSSNISLPFKMSKLKVWRKAIYNFSMTIFRFLWVKFVTLIDIILISFRMWWFMYTQMIGRYNSIVWIVRECDIWWVNILQSCQFILMKYLPFLSYAKFCCILVDCFNTFISHYRWDARSTKFLGPITSRQKLWKVHTKSGQPPSTTKYQLWRENRHFPKWSLNQRPTYEMTALVLKIFSKSSSKKKPSTYSY